MEQPSEIPLLSVIMPVFNEGHIIMVAIEQTASTLDNSGIPYEIIVVNDGSTDLTNEKLRNVPDRVRVIGYKRNKGKGYALKYGLSVAKGKIIVFYDSDLNISPSFIVIYFKELLNSDYDVLIGSKCNPESIVVTSLQRKILSYLYSKYIRMTLNLSVSDTQVGLKCFKGEVVRRVIKKITIYGFAYDVDLLAMINHYGYRIKEMPIKINMEKYGSNVDLRAIIQMFIDTLRISIKLRRMA